MKDVGKMKSEKEIKEKIRECKETIQRYAEEEVFGLAELYRGYLYALKWVLDED